MRALKLLLPEGLDSLLDEIVRDGFFPSKNEAIRAGIHMVLNQIYGEQIYGTFGTKMDRKMTLVTLLLPSGVIYRIKKLVEKGLFTSRSEAMRIILTIHLGAAYLTLTGNPKNANCANCGRFIPKILCDEAIYCPYCGKKLKTKTKPWTIEIRNQK